ncbi:MAG: molybdate ABC transporter substrate-binding protein [Candidatus Acidiferrales bacterium]
MHRTLLTAFLTFALAASITAHGTASAQNKPSSITVSAAASLKDALDAITPAFAKERPNIAIHYNLAASGTLQQQIQQGAPVDVYISASPAQMDLLDKQGLLFPGTRRNLLRNTLVLIVPAGSSQISNFKDLLKPTVRTVAIGEPRTVPAGKYAQEVLTHFRLYQSLTPRLVLAKDVRQVLTYVASGNADAGIVYSTDAKITNQVKVTATAPEDSHDPIIYPVAVLKDAKNIEAAKSFVAFLSSPAAQSIFEKYGFSPAE